MAADMVQCATDKVSHEGWMILVIGKQGSGKTTFIESCTDEDYESTYRDDSSKSHTSRKTYPISASQGGEVKECHYREIPSFLDSMTTSAALLYELALFLVQSHGRNRVASVIYMLNLEQEAQPPPSLPKHLNFAQAWVGRSCPPSTVMVQNHWTHGPNPAVVDLWRQIIGVNASMSQPQDAPVDTISSIIHHSEQALKLQGELMGGTRLKKTTVGKLFEDQLDEWIDDAKKQKRLLKKQKQDCADIKTKIDKLEFQKKKWKKLKL